MKLGLFSVADHYPAQARTAQQYYEELLQQAALADALGFHSFWVAEHHFHEYGIIPRPAIWLTAAAQRTQRIQLGSAVTVLPFEHPLRTAEDFALADVLSGGRIAIGVGSGYLKHEFEGFGIDGAEKRARFDESLEVLLRAWSGEAVNVNGFHSIQNVKLNVLPLQRPHPPVWVAILSNAAAKFVGARRLPILMIPYATTENFDELRQTVSEYREAFVQAGGKAEEAHAMFALHAHFAADFETARAEAQGPMDQYVQSRLYARQRSIDELVARNLIALGNGDDFRRVLARYEEVGFTHCLLMLNYGAMPHEKVIRSLHGIAAAGYL